MILRKTHNSRQIRKRVDYADMLVSLISKMKTSVYALDNKTGSTHKENQLQCKS